MKFNFVSQLIIFNLSVYSIVMLVLYDFEVFCLSSMLITWHFFKGVSAIINDYIYTKSLKLILLFFLQILVIEINHYFFDFLL